MKTETTVSTRPKAGEAKVDTNLTINWEGMTEEDVRALAQQALIVKLQSGWRANGIPEGDAEVNAVDFRVGVRAPRQPKDILSLVPTLSPEQKAALMERLLADQQK